MKEDCIFLDSRYYDINSGIFGRNDFDLGKIKYVGDSILNLTDGKTYRCCGMFGNYVAVINDEGNRVLVKSESHWASGHKRIKHQYHTEIVEDLTKDQLLRQIICNGKSVYPKSNKPKDGVFIPACIIKANGLDPIYIYPEPSPELFEAQYNTVKRLARVLAPQICKDLAEQAQSQIQDTSPIKTKLQELREKNNIDQTELSRRSGISKQIIKKFELPENSLKAAKGDVLLALSKALNCTVEELLS